MVFLHTLVTTRWPPLCGSSSTALAEAKVSARRHLLPMTNWSASCFGEGEMENALEAFPVRTESAPRQACPRWDVAMPTASTGPSSSAAALTETSSDRKEAIAIPAS